MCVLLTKAPSNNAMQTDKVKLSRLLLTQKPRDSLTLSLIASVGQRSENDPRCT